MGGGGNQEGERERQEKKSVSQLGPWYCTPPTPNTRDQIAGTAMGISNTTCLSNHASAITATTNVFLVALPQYSSTFQDQVLYRCIELKDAGGAVRPFYFYGG